MDNENIFPMDPLVDSPDFNDYFRELVRQIENLTVYFNNKFKICDERFEKIEKNINKINDKIDKIKQMENKFIPQRRALKIELWDLENESIIKRLNANDIKSDIKIINDALLYDKKNLPIHYIERNKFRYWLDNRWYDDPHGKYVIDILVQCLKKLYLKNNKSELGLSKFVDNQKYILELETDMYKKKLLKELRDHMISIQQPLQN